MLLELTDVEVRYGSIRALQGISLGVGEGELVALIGSNGAGKSTTLRTISGLLRPSRGTIAFDGKDITGASSDDIVARGISHCPEGRRIFGSLTALMSRPRLLLLDEPSLGLAPILVERIFATIAELKRQGRTILLVEQNVHQALEVADRAYVVETGRITLEGPADVLRHDPKVEQSYLGVGGAAVQAIAAIAPSEGAR
jgi:branched-chain amino acid transport system ATP-binding protein